MRKNKKIIAILTLLVFAMSMIVPVAASADVETATLTANKTEVEGGEAFALTATITGGELDAAVAADPEAEPPVEEVVATQLYVVAVVDGVVDDVATEIVGEEDTTGTIVVNAPAATDEEQTLTYELYEATSQEEAVEMAANANATPLETATVTVAAKDPVTVELEDITVGDTQIVVNFTNAEAGDTLVLTQDGDQVANVTLTAAQAAANTYTFEVPGGATGEYVVTLTNVSADPDATVQDTDTADAIVVGEADADASYIDVEDKEVKVREESTTSISIRDSNGNRVVAEDGIYVWAEERVGQPTSALTNVRIGNAEMPRVQVDGVDTNIFYIEDVPGSDFDIQMLYSRPGTYSVYASLLNPTEELETDEPGYAENAAYGDVEVFKSTSRNVTVEGDKTNVVAIGVESLNSPINPEVVLFNGATYPSCVAKADSNLCLNACGDEGRYCPINDNVPVDEDERVYVRDGEGLVAVDTYFDGEDVKCLDPIYVDPNGVTESEIDIVIYEYRDVNNDGVISDAERNPNNLVAVDAGLDVTFNTNSGAIEVSPNKDTTDYNGKVDVAVTGTTEGNYIIYVKAGKVEVRVPVTVAPLRADTIVKTKEPAVPLAADETIGSGEMRFQILDPNGNIILNPFDGSTEGKLNFLGLDGLRDQLDVTTLTLDGNYEHVTAYSPGYEGKFVKLTKPSASDLKVEDINFVPRGNGEFGITFDEDLVVGDYSLTITIDNGRSITFNWTMQEFGTAQELKLEYDRNTIELNGITKAPSIYFLDEDGVKKDAKNYVELGATGYALKHFNTNTGVVQVENDEKYIGDKINVYAVATREGLTAEAELTVTSGEGMIAFDQTVGPVGVANRVPFKIVDSEGNQLTLGADKQIMSASAVVVSKTNPDANVTASVASYSNSDLLNKGAGVLNLNSDKETNAEIKVTVVARVACPREGYADAYVTQVYSGTLDYKFGTASEFDGRVVVMTIGSTDVIVNNEIVKIDSAPFVNEDWRTMIPFRAMAESFGAKVEWNEEDQTVTTELDGVTVVMTIGSETYTINGEEKTMDTAPVIQDSRTLIPVRFPAEAFGFDVVPTYNADGLTSSVLFTR